MLSGNLSLDFARASMRNNLCMSVFDRAERDCNLTETGTVFRLAIFSFERCSCELFILFCCC